MEIITIVATVVGIVAGIVTIYLSLSRSRIEAKKLRLEIERLEKERKKGNLPLYVPEEGQSAIKELDEYLKRTRRHNEIQLRPNHLYSKAESNLTRSLRIAWVNVRKRKFSIEYYLGRIEQILSELETYHEVNRDRSGWKQW